LVVGPTAIGKTAEAIRIAKELNTEIISADSRQCYEELKIGVARPSDDELNAVKHHFIANHSIQEIITAASFAEEAWNYLNVIFQTHDHAVVCGGTGLYIKALVEGLDDIPEIDSSVRNEVIELYKKTGIDNLRKELLKFDPDFTNTGDINNPARMMRALEVVKATGMPIYHFQTKKEKHSVVSNEQQGDDIRVKFSYRVMEMPREELYKRIDLRVDQMMAAGLEDEAQSLLSSRNLPALQTVGYKELFDFFDGKMSREQAIEKIKQHTRNYAKRQMTWWRNTDISDVLVPLKK
jgi:tRNA dimethylallyltransferase